MATRRVRLQPPPNSAIKWYGPVAAAAILAYVVGGWVASVPRHQYDPDARVTLQRVENMQDQLTDIQLRLEEIERTLTAPDDKDLNGSSDKQ